MFIGVLGIIRLISLFRRVTWRSNLDDQFPDSCGDWSVPHGCTRVTLQKSGCFREQDIPSQNALIFNINVDRVLNTQIEQCVNQLEGAKLMHPSDLSSDNSHGSLIHVSFNSALFGFIDDMYMVTQEYLPSGAKIQQRQLKIQSQLRTGNRDLDVNYSRVKGMLDCLNQTFENSSTTPAPCSL